MIAEETKRDNSQMKALAALTTLYLPLSTVSVRFPPPPWRGLPYMLLRG